MEDQFQDLLQVESGGAVPPAELSESLATEADWPNEEVEAALEQLLELGEITGAISYDDVVEAFPELADGSGHIERIADALSSAGVVVLEEGETVEDEAEETEVDRSSENEAADQAAVRAVDSGDGVGLYFSQVGRVPLLTRDQEIDLAKRIERGLKAREALANGRVPSRSRDQFLHRIEDGISAREHLILANSRLVISVAKKYRGRGLPFLDLIQEGHVGLMRAVKKFDYRRGYKFSTYATWWIRQAVSRVVADQGRTIRVPVHMGDKINRMHRVSRQLTQFLNREPTMDELAEALDVTPDQVEEIIQVAQRPLSLERPVDEEGESELGDFIEDDEALSPEETATEYLLKIDLEATLDSLPAREAKVLKLRYGLLGGRSHTLKEVGHKMGVTRERVRQIEAQALRRLRHPGSSHNLKEYLRQ